MKFLLLFSCSLVYASGGYAQQPVSDMEKAIAEFDVQMRDVGATLTDSARKPATAGQPGWHGRAYEFFRNDYLDAVPHEVVQRGGRKSVLRRNQFGFSVAGPVKIPALWPRSRGTFLTWTYEGVRESIARANLLTVPILAERTGDYSQVVDAAGRILPIYDPTSTAPNPNFDSSRPVSRENLQYTRTPFAGNRIPENRLDPVAQKALSYYPAPNASAGPFFRNNYFVNSPERNTPNGMIVKVDQILAERQRLTVELATSNGLSAPARILPTAADISVAAKHVQNRRIDLDHVFTPSPNTVNTASFKVTRDVVRSGEDEDRLGYPGLLGLRGTDGPFFPVFSIQPYVGMGRQNPANLSAANTFEWSESILLRRGRHTLKLTGTYTARQLNVFNPDYPSSMLRFSAGLTSLPGIVNTGHAFASFLLGLAEYGQSAIVPSPSYFRRGDLSTAFTDRFEIRKNLILNFGATIVRGSQRVEKYNRQSNIDLTLINPANGRPGAMVAAGRNGVPRGFGPAFFNLNPSASITWNPLGDSKSVVRFRYAHGGQPPAMAVNQWGVQGFNAYPAYISQNQQLSPAMVLANGLPGLTTPVPDLRPEAANDTFAHLHDTSGKLPVYMDIHLDLERQLPGSFYVSSTLTYTGGFRLLVDDLAANPNAIPLDALQYRDLLNDEKFIRNLRPYPQYRGFSLQNLYARGYNRGSSISTKIEKRSSRGLFFSASYNFGKQTDDFSGPYGKQDYYNRDLEWSIGANSKRHTLQFTYVYELPFGPGKAFLRSPGIARYIAGGWTLSGSGSVSSGTPLALRALFNNTGGVVQALRVNVVPGVDPRVADPGPSGWFNPAAFDQPAGFTIGNLSRTHPFLRNPGTQTHDLSMAKRLVFAQERSLEVSLAAFNFVNMGNWNAPDNIIGPRNAPNVNAGKIIGSTGGRVIQLGLRFNF